MAILPARARLPAPVAIKKVSLVLRLTCDLCLLVVGPEVPSYHEVVEVGVHVVRGV